jgi:hypothetical protein
VSARLAAVALALLLLCGAPAPARAAGVGQTLLWYLPNRVFDLVDVVRARVRAGPGLAGGLRATRDADLFLGSYEGFYFGLPGPRGRTRYPLPFGTERRSGIEIGAADRTTRGPGAPRYGETEIGLDTQLGIVGVAVGVDPFELIDLALGFLLFDLGGDDF